MKQKEEENDIEPTETTDELEQFEKQLAEKEEALLRTQADLQNVRRRAEEDRVRLTRIGAEGLLQAIIPTLDHFELALKNAPTEKNDFVTGIEATFTGLITALENEGVSRIDQVEVPVDPAKHEVIAADDSKPENTVVEVYQTGYMLGDSLVRAAKVKAGSKA
jgi:molecular chaperone GrpE